MLALADLLAGGQVQLSQWPGEVNLVITLVAPKTANIFIELKVLQNKVNTYITMLAVKRKKRERNLIIFWYNMAV